MGEGCWFGEEEVEVNRGWMIGFHNIELKDMGAIDGGDRHWWRIECCILFMD